MTSPSPNDSLDPVKKEKQYPKCAFKMYQRVHVTDWGYTNMVKRMRTAHKKITNRMKRKGFSAVSFDFLYIQNKHDTTSPLAIIEPDRIGEVIGMHCRHGHPLIMVCNENYLNEGHCHSGVEYTYDILFRKTDDKGRKVCFIIQGFFDNELASIKRK